MNRIRSSLGMALLFVFVLFPAKGFAQQLPNLSFELSYAVADFKYQEEGGDFMKSEGFIHGPSATFTYMDNRYPFFAELFGEYLTGSGEYNGGLTNIVTGESIPYSHDDDEYDIFLGQLVLGWVVSPGSSNRPDNQDGRWLIKPYTGIGFRYLRNDSNDQFAYEREIYWTYLPIGVDVRYRLAEKWVVGLRPQFNLLLTGHIESDVFEDSFSNNLGFGDGYGFWAALPIERHFKRVGLTLEPFVRYWNMRESDPDTVVVSGLVPGFDVLVTGVEPENDTLVYGLRIGVEFPPLRRP